MKQRIFLIAGIVIAMWIIEVANFTSGHALNRFGLVPREWTQLWGIYTSPFLHGGIGHLSVNTMPFIVLGWLVINRGIPYFIGISLSIITLAGIGVWLMARDAVHVGASGWIFGLFGFLVGRAWAERSVASILVAILTVFLYGGLLWGILPVRRCVSWEGHLFGLLAGVVTAQFYHRRRSQWV